MDTSSYEHSPAQTEHRFARGQRYSDNRLETDQTTTILEQETSIGESEPQSENVVPMEHLPDDFDAAITDQFVSQTPDTITQSSITNATPIYLQQPIVRRKALDEGSLPATGDTSSSSKDD